MPREKKTPPLQSSTPIFPRFVLDAAILARKRGRGGEAGEDENPVAVQLIPPDQSHARFLEVDG